MFLVRGDNSEKRLKETFGEGEGSFRDKFRWIKYLNFTTFHTKIRHDSEPGVVLVVGSSQMLPLAKKYFYQSLDQVIRNNEKKLAA